jgi:hypothetical protein
MLVGLSILAPVFAMLASDPGSGQALWVFAAPVLLAAGLALQRVVTSSPRKGRTEAQREAARGRAGLPHGP